MAAEPGVRCEGHDELVKQAGMNLQATLDHTRQLSSIFNTLGEIQTTVDINMTRAEHRDQILQTLQDSVDAVNTKIENGLRSEVRTISNCIKSMTEASEKRKVEREEERKRGVRGFIHSGWTQFKSHASFILVTTTIITSLWFVVWGFSKVAIFNEGPAGMLRLFKIGG
jgi:hypothetical protein